MNNKDIFYQGYGFNPYPPITNLNPMDNYYNIQNKDIFNRLDSLERKINRLEQRITRLETPYHNINKEPDNNMYMM